MWEYDDKGRMVVQELVYRLSKKAGLETVSQDYTMIQTKSGYTNHET